MAASLFFIGMGAIHWAKTLMPDEEVIIQRHEFRSSDEDRADFIKTAKDGAAAAGLGRRSLIKRSLGLSLGLVLVGKPDTSDSSSSLMQATLAASPYALSSVGELGSSVCSSPAK
jgi:hypothetical protein